MAALKRPASQKSRPGKSNWPVRTSAKPKAAPSVEPSASPDPVRIRLRIGKESPKLAPKPKSDPVTFRTIGVGTEAHVRTIRAPPSGYMEDWRLKQLCGDAPSFLGSGV